MNKLAQKLTQEIEKFGDVSIAKSGAKIAFKHNTRFAQVNPNKEGVSLEFITPSLIKHTRLQVIKQLKPDKVSHQIDISEESELDPQVLGWLRIAHATN